MPMTVEALLITLLVGAVAGWLAGQIVTGYGFGLLGNIVVGILGAFVAGFLFHERALIGTPIIDSILWATLGAVILLFLIGLIRRAT